MTGSRTWGGAGRRRTAEKSKPRFSLVKTGKIDVTFFALTMILLVIGLIMLFSASWVYAYSNENGNPYYFIERQIGFAVVGVGLMLFFSRVDYHFFRRFAWQIYAVALILLVVVLALPSTAGVHRWINLGPIDIQPSEIAKFAVVLVLSHMIALNYKQMGKFTFSVLFLGGLLMVTCVLVVIEPHLSGTILIFSIGLVLLIIGGIKSRYIILGVLGGAGLGFCALFFFVSYSMSRVEHWLHPELDPTGGSYQTLQSLYAIGSGGFLGRGLGQSRQKYLWVPEPQNDFIFPIICEELGFVGALVIITLFALLLWRGFTIAMRAPDKFGSLMAIGLTFQVGLQAVLNILVVTNTVPNTGISLPFFSYGGSSLIMLLSEMGIVLSISRSSTVTKT